jgi:hypothetical protein
LAVFAAESGEQIPHSESIFVSRAYPSLESIVREVLSGSDTKMNVPVLAWPALPDEV